MNDAFLQRWLIARGNDVDRATECIVAHTAWRTAFVGRVGRVTEDSIASELACDKAFLQPNTSTGVPVVLFKASRHDMGKRDLDETKRLICYILDNSLAAADLDANPAGKMVCLFDLPAPGRATWTPKPC